VHSSPRLYEGSQLWALVSSEFGDRPSASSAGQERLGGRHWLGVVSVNGCREIGASQGARDPESRKSQLLEAVTKQR
jgi:hypothetical protein